jgi:hypothetical protein
MNYVKIQVEVLVPFVTCSSCEKKGHPKPNLIADPTMLRSMQQQQSKTNPSNPFIPLHRLRNVGDFVPDKFEEQVQFRQDIATCYSALHITNPIPEGWVVFDFKSNAPGDEFNKAGYLCGDCRPKQLGDLTMIKT